MSKLTISLIVALIVAVLAAVLLGLYAAEQRDARLLLEDRLFNSEKASHLVYQKQIKACEQSSASALEACENECSAKMRKCEMIEELKENPDKLIEEIREVLGYE